MSVGFRPTEEDLRVIEANRREDEKTSDVIRRALRLLDREAWEERARADMHRLRNEDLSAEADAWEYDADGNIRIVRHRSDCSGASGRSSGMIRGAVYPVDLGDAKRGHEQRGRRLGLVISIEQNAWSTVTIIPTSTSAQPAVFRPEVIVAGRDTKILIDQIRTIDTAYVTGELVDYLSAR
jgi:mRNA interferase MazF